MKRYFLTVIALLFLSGFVFSQADIPLRYAKNITQQNLREKLTIIASAGMEGRLTGTKGQRKAAAYIQSQFQQIGLKKPSSLNGYQQYFPILKDTLLPKSFKINKQNLKYGIDYALLSGSSIKKAFKSKKIVFCGYGIKNKNYNDYTGKKVKGKVVLVISGEPKVNGKYLIKEATKNNLPAYSMIAKAAAAKEEGAIAVLYVNTDWDSIPSAKVENAEKNILYSPRFDSAADITMILMAAPELKNILNENEEKDILEKAKSKTSLDKIEIEKNIKIKLTFKKNVIAGKASNVIGMVEGSDKKDEYILITAHYDHLGKKGNTIYYGADDDGSGTASVIEMARAFAKAKKEGKGPKRTVVFMAFSGEEEGLLGSKFYSDNPVFPLDKTSVDLNTDMIGRVDPNRKFARRDYLYVVGNDKLSSELTPIITNVNDKYTRLKLDYKYNDPNDPERLFYRSDHYNFARKGVPVIFFTSGLHADYHRPSDTVDKINFDLMEKRVRFIFLCAWEMANRDEMLKRDKSVLN